MLGESNHGSAKRTARLSAMMDRLGDQLLEALSPTRCAGCERLGSLVCDECLNRLELIDPGLACARCGAPFGRMLCTECYGVEVATQACLACATFQDPLSRMIRAYKDGGERRLAPLFAEMLYDTALHAQRFDPQRFGAFLDGSDFLLFVPATARAFQRRGFDHMEAVARSLGDLSGVPFVDALVKHGVGDQREMGRAQRIEGSRGVYEVVEPLIPVVRGASILLIDDVITTGATVTAGATALRDAGAASVRALALARVMG